MLAGGAGGMIDSHGNCRCSEESPPIGDMRSFRLSHEIYALLLAVSRVDDATMGQRRPLTLETLSMSLSICHAFPVPCMQRSSAVGSRQRRDGPWTKVESWFSHTVHSFASASDTLVLPLRSGHGY